MMTYSTHLARIGRSFCIWICAGAVLLSACSRTSKREAEIIAKALEGSAVHIDLVNREQLEAVLRTYEGQVILVAYWATTSGMSMQQIPRAVVLANYYGDRGLQLITVSMENPNDRQRVADFIEASGAAADPHIANFLSRYGGSEIAFQDFKIEGGLIPFFQLFDRTGKLSKTYDTASQQLDSDIESLLVLDQELTALMEEAERIKQQTSPPEPFFKPRPMFEDEQENRDPNADLYP